MPSLTLPDQLIWFAHCPKAGGTSVEQFMVARWGDAVGHLHWGWDRWWQQGGWRVADPPNSPQHMVWQDARVHLSKTPDVVFAVVRDPVARMASEHRWQRRGRRGSYLGKALAWLPFSIWLWLMLAVARKHPYAFDNHLRPQSDFIPEGARVFRLEDGLGPVTHWLAEVTGDATQDTPTPHALPTGPGPHVALRDRVLIAHAFAEDYARFGYPMAKGPVRRFAPVGMIAPFVAFLDRHGQL